MALVSRALKPFVLLLTYGVILSVHCGPPAKRSYSLPSVSDAHYQEILPDGSYKYAYTGEHRYVAERRLTDGTVEGESLYIRPDGVPIKVHYFADGKGYRPKTEVLYKERLVTTARRVPVIDTRRVVVPEVRRVVDVISPPPAVVVAPPRDSARVNLVDGRTGQGVNAASNGGDVAAAVPSITAIVGPGAHAVIQPEAEAYSGSGASFRSVGSGGDVAVANPQITTIAGAGSSVVIAPKARASTGLHQPNTIVKEVHHTPSHIVSPARHVVSPARHVVVPPSPVIVERPRVVATHSAAPGYVYNPPTRVVVQEPVVVAPQPVVVQPPTLTAVRSSGVVVIPPRPSYSYEYSYSAPDGKHPHRDNSAYVNVKVNQ